MHVRALQISATRNAVNECLSPTMAFPIILDGKWLKPTHRLHYVARVIILPNLRSLGWWRDQPWFWQF